MDGQTDTERQLIIISYTPFFYKNHAYKNVEAQITPKLKNIVVILLVAISISFPASDDALIRKKGGTHCRWQHRHQRRIVIGVVVVVAAYTNKQI